MTPSNTITSGNTIVDFLIGNIIWEFLVIVFAAIFLKLLPTYIGARKIAKMLLKDNRATRDNGHGKFFADRFVNIWNTTESLPLRYGRQGDHYALTFGGQARHWLNVMDDNIVALGLATPDTNHQDFKAIRPIRSFKNRIVYRMVKRHLIRRIGDNPNYYRDQEAQRNKIS